MSKLRFFFFLLLQSQLICSCGNTQNPASAPSADTAKKLKAAKDAAPAEMEAYQDCNEVFFSHVQRSPDTSHLTLTLKNGNELSWNQFINQELMSQHVRWGMKNIDNDAIEELVAFNYTGGAHCCDEVYVFEKEDARYIQKAKLFGSLCMDAASNIFTFSFNEGLGYFFACYACGFADSSGRFKPIREIELRYDNGSFAVLPPHPDTEKQLMNNLSLLSMHKYEDMEEGLMDSGWRKEFAMNIAVWHYTHGKNWTATKQLFDKYYKFKDAPRVWKEFRNTTKEIETQNSF